MNNTSPTFSEPPTTQTTTRVGEVQSRGVTSICGHTGMCHFLGYLLGFCPRFMGILSKTLPDLWVYFSQNCGKTALKQKTMCKNRRHSRNLGDLPDLWVYILQYHMRFMGPNVIRKCHTPVTTTYKLPPEQLIYHLLFYD